MGIEAGDSGAPERQHSSRQNNLGHKRQQNQRGKRTNNTKGTQGNQNAQSHQANGYVSASQSENGNPGNDTASIDRHVLKLSTEAATVQEQLAYYRGILDERSQLRRLQVELQTTKDGAEATRQYHLTTVNHLEERLKISESECDEMKKRLRSLHEAAEEKDDTLKKYEACLAQQDAVDREKSGQIEDLTRKLQHAHLTAEQYRGQAEAANKRLTQAEEAKKAREAELANLRLEVQTQVDKRKLEEAARNAGINQTQKEYEALLDQNQSRNSYLEARLKEANLELKAMDKHYKDECEKLCVKIDEINNEHRRPRGPMLTEKELLDLVSSLLPIGEGNAVHLGPSLIEQLQKAIFPNTWEFHYAFVFGTVLEFLLHHSQQFLRRPDHAFYRTQPSIRFGTALDQMAIQDMTTQASGKRIMTPAERTVGPPAAAIAPSAPSTSSLLSRLQRTSDTALPSASASQNLLPGLQASSSAGPGQPIFMQQGQGDLQQSESMISGPSEQASHLSLLSQSSGQPRAVVVTPVNPQVKTKQKGQGQHVLNDGQRQESGGHHQTGWSNTSQKQPDLTPQGDAAGKAHVSAAPSNEQRPHGKSRKQNGKAEERLPPGMSQGRQKDASTLHATNTGPAKGQSQPQNGSQRNMAEVSNIREANLQGLELGQDTEALKGDHGKQQAKRANNRKGSQEQQYQGPPGFEMTGQNSAASASGHLSAKSEKITRKGPEETSRKREGADVHPEGDDASAATSSKAIANQAKKAAASYGPPSHPSWESSNGDGSQPQRQQRNRRKGAREAAQ